MTGHASDYQRPSPHSVLASSQEADALAFAWGVPVCWLPFGGGCCCIRPEGHAMPHRDGSGAYSYD